MAKKPSSAAYQHTPAAYRLLVPAAMLVLVFALTSQQKVVAARADADTLKEVGQRETAAHELQLAHEIVEKARSKAAAAKTELEDFIARHFEEHRLRGAAPLPKFRESRPARKGVVNPQWEQIDKQLTELKTHREDLLGRLTPAHP
ncbi:MAG: hypothetical protein HY288_01860 [Planctomycetia bacterium]|nr:hypothetical protein [Planctomycetia bacterium]